MFYPLQTINQMDSLEIYSLNILSLRTYREHRPLPFGAVNMEEHRKVNRFLKKKVIATNLIVGDLIQLNEIASM
jgi:hypothetical protein